MVGIAATCATMLQSKASVVNILDSILSPRFQEVMKRPKGRYLQSFSSSAQITVRVAKLASNKLGFARAETGPSSWKWTFGPRYEARLRERREGKKEIERMYSVDYSRIMIYGIYTTDLSCR